MIIYTFFCLIIEIVLTFLYVNNNIEILNKTNKLTGASLKKLKFIKTILFVFSSITILAFWVTILDFSKSKFIASLGLLIFDFIVLGLYKRKLKIYILKNKNTKKQIVKNQSLKKQGTKNRNIKNQGVNRNKGNQNMKKRIQTTQKKK